MNSYGTDRSKAGKVLVGSVLVFFVMFLGHLLGMKDVSVEAVKTEVLPPVMQVGTFFFCIFLMAIFFHFVAMEESRKGAASLLIGVVTYPVAMALRTTFFMEDNVVYLWNRLDVALAIMAFCWWVVLIIDVAWLIAHASHPILDHPEEKEAEPSGETIRDKRTGVSV